MSKVADVTVFVRAPQVARTSALLLRVVLVKTRHIAASTNARRRHLLRGTERGLHHSLCLRKVMPCGSASMPRTAGTHKPTRVWLRKIRVDEPLTLTKAHLISVLHMRAKVTSVAT